MLLSDPTTKKAASAKAETWRQEIFDICPTFSDRAPRRTCVVGQETAGRDAFIPKEMRISGAGPKVASHR
jgi:hypothetical protein